MTVDVAAIPNNSADPTLDIPHRDLLEMTSRFAHGFLRWVDARPAGGLTYPRLRVLEALHCQGPAKMKTLADTLGLTARNMTAVADSLESEGLLRRVDHPSDRRVTLLELTDAGLAAADESLVPRLAEISRLFDELSPSARDDLRNTLASLVAAMESSPCNQHERS
ncbi:MAG TPA: MarR family transcriptional regulator [Ilumatobacteraceae bacterium]|jgi:DNA-binding MarR family transcriptional regulator|nr:MarR family transcriptional regulator [Ilumatobacteraceae bacterium]